MQTQLDLPFCPRLPFVLDPHEYWRRYQDYLRSWLWRRYIRPVTFHLADYACQAGKPGCIGRAQECHHSDYSLWYLGLDQPGVTTFAVCRPCHSWIHSHPIMLPDAATDNEPPLPGMANAA